MANPEHLAILRQGVEVWNQWREENPGIVPDLSGGDFNGSNLQNANLQGANLSNTNLRRANLQNANLQGANLVGTYLLDTHLKNTDLSVVYMSSANLSRANLSGANLESTTFNKTILDNTNFTEAKLSNTSFLNVDLSQALNLERIIYNESANIDLRSLYLSQGKLPQVFLEACGITDEILQALPQLLGIQSEIQYIEVIKEVPKIEYKYIETAQPTPTIDPQEIEFQKELLTTLRSRNQELLKSKALFGLGHVPQHILLEIKEIRREIAERKAYLRGHNVTIADHYDD